MMLRRLISAVEDPRAAEPAAPAVARTGRSVDLEMHRRNVGPDGVGDFFWPVSPLDYVPVRDAIATGLVAAVRAETDDCSATEALRLLVMPVLLEAIAIYCSQRLVAAFQHAGYSVAAPARGRVLRAVAAGTEPLPPALVRTLAIGPSVPRRLRAPARLARDLLIQKNIRRRTVMPPDLSNDIISTSVDPLPEFHAGGIDGRVIYHRWHCWFQPQAARLDARHQRLARRMVDAIAASFAVSEVKLEQPYSGYIVRWLADAIALVEQHLRALDRLRSSLPRQLWTGSGGIIWNKMMQQAVRGSGGYVIGHDHGAGQGHIEPNIFRTVFEYEHVDRFVTYTAAQADGQRAALRPELQINPRQIDVTGIGGGLSFAQLHRTKPTRPRRIMLLSSYYFGDVVTCEPFVSDLSTLDFESRLIGDLERRGYDVIYKPHPLIVTRPSYDMARQLGASETDEPSEQAITTADVVIMIDPLSTAFATTLASGCPAVFVDFGLSPLREHARSLLARRVPIVKAVLDAENRVRVDWNALGAAIEAAPAMTDNSFVRAYYGS